MDVDIEPLRILSDQIAGNHASGNLVGAKTSWQRSS